MTYGSFKWWVEESWPGIVCVVLIAACVFFIVLEAKQWGEFAVTHNCKVVGKMSGSTGVGLGFVNGQVGTVVTGTSGKTGYLCDDGVTYWR